MELLELAAAAGFETGVEKFNAAKDLQRRLAIAYEHYKIVTHADMEAFREKLYKATRQYKAVTMTQDGYEKHDVLELDPIGKYAGLPPADVLEKVLDAKGKGIFDAFEVAHIVSKTRIIPDPIVFARINGCSDYFYIAEWGDDIKLTDLVPVYNGG